MRYEAYAATETGRALIEVIDQPDRFIQFEMLERLGRPAVQAIARDVAPIIEALPSQRERNNANQFCGWYVGQYVKANRRQILRPRGSVVDGPYKTGAVWELGDPSVEILSGLPHPAASRVELLVKKNDEDEVVADWDIVYSAMNPTRHIRRISGLNRPVREALRRALRDAEQCGLAYILVRDPNRLFPKSQWKTE